MTDWIGETPRTLNELQAFDAMRLFLEAYWERGGKQSDDLATLLGNLDREIWANSMPGDPAQWSDFRKAVSVVLAKELAAKIARRPAAEVFGSLQRNDPRLSLADMDAAVFEEAKRRARDED